MSIDQLTAEAMALPPEERLAFAYTLIDSVPGQEEDEFDPEYMQEIHRRVEEMESGKVRGLSHEEAMREAWHIVNAAD